VFSIFMCSQFQSLLKVFKYFDKDQVQSGTLVQNHRTTRRWLIDRAPDTFIMSTPHTRSRVYVSR